MKKTIDQRGFAQFTEFEDTYGAKIRVKESSADPLDKVWVFIQGGRLHPGMPGDHLRQLYIDERGQPVALRWQDAEGKTLTKMEQDAAAHLNVKQAKKLIAALQAWVDGQS